MKKKMLILIAIVFVSFILLVLYLSTNKTPLPSTSSTTKAVETALEDENSFTGSFADLLKMQRDFMCDFNYTSDAGLTSAGTSYVDVSGKKVRVDFTTELEDGTTNDGSGISDGSYNYIWGSNMEQGIKTALLEGQDSFFDVEQTDDSVDSYLSDDYDYDFDCDTWNVDDGMFVPPQDIEFIDMSEVLNDALENSGVDCSSCDQIEDAGAKNMCLQALGCN